MKGVPDREEHRRLVGTAGPGIEGAESLRGHAPGRGLRVGPRIERGQIPLRQGQLHGIAEPSRVGRAGQPPLGLLGVPGLGVDAPETALRLRDHLVRVAEGLAVLVERLLAQLGRFVVALLVEQGLWASATSRRARAAPVKRRLSRAPRATSSASCIRPSRRSRSPRPS